MATRKKTSGSLLQLKIELAGIKPLIWRRVIVPEAITLAKLHQVIQAVMGWTDSHLHEFEIAGEQYGIPDPDDSFGPPVVSEIRLFCRLPQITSSYAAKNNPYRDANYSH